MYEHEPHPIKSNGVPAIAKIRFYMGFVCGNGIYERGINRTFAVQHSAYTILVSDWVVTIKGFSMFPFAIC